MKSLTSQLRSAFSSPATLLPSIPSIHHSWLSTSISVPPCRSLGCMRQHSGWVKTLRRLWMRNPAASLHKKHPF